MPTAVRLGDICTGHFRAGPRPCISASSDTFINGRGATRVGDTWALHGFGKGVTPHFGTQVTGSPNVYVNGAQLARVGDTINCGSRNAKGSNNVIVN